MKRIRSGTFTALAVLTQTALFSGTPTLKPGTLTVGKNLQAFTTIELSDPATADIQLTVKSADPTKVLLAKSPELQGSESVTVTVKTRFRESPEIWVQALGDAGSVTYTASAAGFEAGIGTVILSPSGVVIVGPFQAPGFVTTPRAWPSKITLNAGRLDSSLNYVGPQYVRGGFSLEAILVSSNTAVGKLTPSPIVIAAATYTTTAEFRPAAVGSATLSVATPPGFSRPSNSNSVAVTVRTPGIAVADDITIGENLQVQGILNLGEPAPPDGLAVTLKSSDPQKLLLSTSRTEVGKASIEIKIPGGGASAKYYLQALGRSGTVEHTATADGFNARTGTIGLAPSGIILSLEHHGPPDEAEVFRPDSAGGPQNGFIEHLSKAKPTPLVLYAAYLDPRTSRAADITVQQLRAGLSLSVRLTNTNAAVGTVAPTVTFEGGADRVLMSFKPQAVGKTVIAVVAPPTFKTPSNSTELLAIVRE